jgi:sulfur relay (sulfurtransferase) DsrC/TusE family protein
MAGTDGIEPDDTKWQYILKTRDFFQEHIVMMPVRKLRKILLGGSKGRVQAVDHRSHEAYGGLSKPTGCV